MSAYTPMVKKMTWSFNSCKTDRNPDIFIVKEYRFSKWNTINLHFEKPGINEQSHLCCYYRT